MYQYTSVVKRSMFAVCTSLLALVLLLPFFASAQAPQNSEGKSDDVTTVATVNLQNAKVTQAGRTFTIQFSISNRVGTQPGIRYGAMLVLKNEKGQTIVDRYVADETLTLDSGESVERSLTYTPPAVLGGTYGLVLVSQNENGFPFGMSYLGDFEVGKGGGGVLIHTDSCYLTVKGEASGARYTPEQGIDIGQGEVLISHCTLENTGATDVTASPRMTTYERSRFGAVVDAQGGDVIPVTLKGGEKRTVTIELPRVNVPQAYDVVLTYGEGGNSATLRYVVRGGSGTIQNLVFDKNFYEKGDTAVMTFVWSKSADGFDGARVKAETPLTDPRVTITLRNEKGDACAEPYAYKLEMKPVHTLSIPVTATCQDPRVGVVLADASVGTLSDINYTIDSPEPVTPPPTPPQPPEEQPKGMRIPGSTIILVSIILVVLIVGIGAALLAFRGKKDSNTPTTPLALLIGMGALLGGAGTAHADTFTVHSWIPDIQHSIIYTINFNKAAYNPGETINITASGVLDGDCGNTCPDGVECRGSGLWIDSEDGVDISPTPYIIPIVDGAITVSSPVFGSLNRTASMSNGTHRLHIGGTSVSQAELDAMGWWYSFDMYYGVGGPPNYPPTTSAGPDVTITLPTSSGSPQGASAVDTNTPVSVSWAYTWGPDWGTLTPTITNGNTLTPTFSGLTTPGEYFFELTATDALGMSATDEMEMVVEPAAPSITQLELCDPGPTNCSSTNRTVATGTPLVVRWQSSNTTKCIKGAGGASDFSTGNAVSGNDAVTASSSGGVTTLYPIQCGDGTATATAQIGALTQSGGVTPVLTFVPKIVEKGNEVTITWDTNNGNETLCSLTGGSVNYPSLPGGGDPETGSVDVTVQGRTPFTITCGSQVVTQVVDIVPTGWDS